MVENQESNDNQQSKDGKKWWGSSLDKLKKALSRTKSAIVDSVVVGETGEQDVENAPQSELSPPTPPRPLLEETRLGKDAATYTSATTSATASAAAAASPTASPSSSSRSLATFASPPKTAQPLRAIDDDFLEELEEKLIRADLGLNTAETLVAHLRKEAKAKNWNSRDVQAFLQKEFKELLASAPNPKLRYVPGKLNIYLVVGVNGTGKTTSIGKLAYRLKSEGKRVLMAAGDTFRAAAETQLEIWAGRAGVDIVRLEDGSDPGAVVFQAIQKATADQYDALVIDTAGRLHNKVNLMAELKKVRGVIDKKAPDAMLEVLLVLDASIGQNGLQQATVFTEVCPLSGVILTKLDGSAKGGVVFSVARDLKIPVKLIGLGEQMDDLRDFEPELFVDALFN